MHKYRVHNDPNHDETNKYLPAEGERRIMMVPTFKTAAKNNNIIII